jgi:hypothetical protein
MRYFPFIVFCMLYASCTQRETIHYQRFTDSFFKYSNVEQVFRLKNFEKQDSDAEFSTEGIFSVDSLVMFRLKSKSYRYFKSKRSFLNDTTDVYVDSSGDGGNTWGMYTNKFAIPTLFPDGFYVSNNIIYIFAHQYLYRINRHNKPRIVADSIGFVEYSSFDKLRNKLVLVTDNRQCFMLQDNHVFEFKVLDSLYPNVQEYSYFNDTLFIRCNQSDYKNEPEVLDKIDSNGNLISTTVLPTYGADDRRLNTNLIVDSPYFLVGYTKRDSDYNRESILFISNDYGKNWKPVLKDVKPIVKFCYADSLLVSTGKGDIGHGLYLSKEMLKPFTLVSSSTFFDENEKELFWLGNSNNVYFSVSDVKTRSQTIVQVKNMPADSICRLIAYSIAENPNHITITVKLDKAPNRLSRINLQLHGANSYDFQTTSSPTPIWISSKYTFTPVDESKTIWECRFPPTEIHAEKGEGYRLVLDYYDNTYHQQYPLKEQTFNPIPWSVSHPQLFIIAKLSAAILGIFILLTLIYWWAPYKLYLLYTATPFFRKIAKSVKWGASIFELLDSLTFTSLLVNSNRVADAWIRKHSSITSYFLNSEETSLSHDPNKYIPLPVRLHSLNGYEIEKPSPTTISQLFDVEQVCIQIVGVGGMGKTTLALQIGRWVADPVNARYFNNHVWIPVFIEEETTNLVASVQAKIQGITHKKIEFTFLKNLLSRRRVIVIIDSISERSIAMQEHVQKLHGTLDITALLITTRTKLNMGISESILLYPRPMDSVTMFQFVNDALVKEGLTLFESALDRTDIFKKMLSVFDKKDEKIPVIPILVHLLTTRVIHLAKDRNEYKIVDIIENMPSNVPEIFTEYLIGVNPATGSNLLSNDEVLLYSEIIAECSVMDTFTPSDANLSTTVLPTLQSISKRNPQDIVQRLIDNGILKRLVYANSTFVRFDLDPLAEWLSALYKAKKAGSQQDKWQALYDEIDAKKAQGFRQILGMIHATYADKFGWPKNVGRE